MRALTKAPQSGVPCARGNGTGGGFGKHIFVIHDMEGYYLTSLKLEVDDWIQIPRAKSQP
jgi:hypothetical protein